MKRSSKTKPSYGLSFVLGVARRFKHSGLALVEQGTQSALNFITMLLISKFCGLEALGVYATGRFLMLLLGGMQNSLISFPYTIFFRQEESDSPKFARQHLLMCLAFGTVASLLFVVLAFVATIVSLSESFNVVLISLALAVATPMYLVREFSRRHEFAHLRTDAAMWFSVIVASLQLGGLVLLWSQQLLTVESAFLLMAAAYCVANVVWVVARAGEFANAKTADPSHAMASLLSKNWKVGKWIFSTQTATDALMLSIQSLLVFLVDPKAGGIFAACFAVVSLCNPVVRGLSNLLTPDFAKTFANGTLNALFASVVKATQRFVVLLLVLGLGIVFFGEYLVVLFYDKPIEQLKHILAVLTLAMMAQAAGLPAFHALNVVSQPHRAFMPRVVGVLLAALFLVCWGFSFRELGAAYGFLIANVVISVLTFYQFQIATEKKAFSKSTLASI